MPTLYQARGPRFESLAAGLYLSETREMALPRDALLVANNVDFLVSGGVIGRRGTTKYNSSALNGPARGLWRHYPRAAGFGTGELVAIVKDGTAHDFYEGNDGTGVFTEIGAASVTPADADLAVPVFVNWPAKNKTFWCYGDDAVALRSFDGSSVAAVSVSGGLQADRIGPYLELHKSRLYATYFGERNFSVYASDINDETTWTAATNQLSVNDPQGGVITGLVSFLDYLLIFKSTSTFRFSGDIGAGGKLARYSDRGCVAPLTLQRTPYGVIFLDRDGLYITDGQSALGAELSKPIRPLFVSRTTQEGFTNAIGRWFPRRNQYWLKLDPDDADGYILHRVELFFESVLNPSERSRIDWMWSHHTNLPMTASGCVFESEEDTGDIVFGDEDGFVWYGDTGSQDDGEDYESKIQTISPLLDGDERTCRIYRVKTLHRATGALSGAIRYDQHQSDDVTFSIGESTVTTIPKETRASIHRFDKMGRYASISLARTGDGPQFEVHVVSVDTKKRSARVWRNVNA